MATVPAIKLDPMRTDGPGRWPWPNAFIDAIVPPPKKNRQSVRIPTQEEAEKFCRADNARRIASYGPLDWEKFDRENDLEWALANSQRLRIARRKLSRRRPDLDARRSGPPYPPQTPANWGCGPSQIERREARRVAAMKARKATE